MHTRSQHSRSPFLSSSSSSILCMLFSQACNVHQAVDQQVSEVDNLLTSCFRIQFCHLVRRLRSLLATFSSTIFNFLFNSFPSCCLPGNGEWSKLIQWLSFEVLPSRKNQGSHLCNEHARRRGLGDNHRFGAIGEEAWAEFSRIAQIDLKSAVMLNDPE